MQSAFWVPPGSYPSTQAREHDAGDCPAPLTRLYAIAAAPAQPPIIEHHREPRAGFAFSGSKPASVTTRGRSLPFRGRLRARFTDPTPSLPEQSCAECSRYSVARGATPLPTSHRIAAKKSTATAARGCPITGRGTRKHTSTTELHHLDARRRGHAKCRPRPRKMK